MCQACPFAMTEESEYANNLGCLPSVYDIFQLMRKHNSNWSCHEDDKKLCSGYIATCRDENIKFKHKPIFGARTWLETGEIKLA